MGLSRGSSKGHIARATLEAIAFQSKEVIDVMAKDAGIDIKELRVDGGATANDTLMQIQSNAMQVKVIRPEVLETTALGAAYFAGLAIGFWNLEELKKQWSEDQKFEPNTDMEEVYKMWSRAVERSKNWMDAG